MIRVLLADDHRLVRDGIKWMLVDEPSIEVVGEAAGGEELLTVLDGMEVDVVLLDMRMPGMSGLEVLKALADSPEPPYVLMLSMYHDPGLIQQAVELGARGYLRKSAGREELIRAVAAVAAGRPYLQGELAHSVIATLVDETPGRGPLSDREREIVSLMAAGLQNKRIAESLGMELTELRREVQEVFAALGVRSRSAAVAVALRLGIIE